MTNVDKKLQAQILARYREKFPGHRLTLGKPYERLLVVRDVISSRFGIVDSIVWKNLSVASVPSCSKSPKVPARNEGKKGAK